MDEQSGHHFYDHKGEIQDDADHEGAVHIFGVNGMVMMTEEAMIVIVVMTVMVAVIVVVTMTVVVFMIVVVVMAGTGCMGMFHETRSYYLPVG